MAEVHKINEINNIMSIKDTSFIDSALDAFLLIDSHLKVIDINKSFLQLFDVVKSDCVEKNLITFLIRKDI